MPLSKLLFLILFIFSSRIGFAENKINTGSGFFITSSGFFITNYHVIKGSSSITLIDNFGYKHNAVVIDTNINNDIALLKVEGIFEPLAIEPSDRVLRGAEIVAIGYPNVDIQGISPKVTDGLINSLTGIKDDPRHFQISAPIQGGNSGGPLLNMSGNVIGLVSAKLSTSYALNVTGDIPQNVNYAIKSNLILDFVKNSQSIKKLLKQPNLKKLSAVSNVYSEAEKSVALVLTTIKTNKTIERENTKVENNWELLFSDVGKSYFANFKTIKNKNNNIKIWGLTDYESSISSSGYTYTSAQYLREYNCNSNKFKTIRELGYDGHKGIGKITYEITQEGYWIDIPPESIVGSIAKIICNH